MVTPHVRHRLTLPLSVRKADALPVDPKAGALPSKKEEQIAWAEVYPPNRPDVDGEFMSPEDIKLLAYRFMIDGDIHRFDLKHNGKVEKDLYLVESFIARAGDPDFIPGSWVVAVYVKSPTLWAQVKRGELNGFSVEALVKKKPTAVTLDLPDLLTGTTSAADDGHTHTFAVKFDKDGKFLGGSTSFTNGHNHRILAGTITQRTNDHTHRFSAVDTLTVSEG